MKKILLQSALSAIIVLLSNVAFSQSFQLTPLPDYDIIVRSAGNDSVQVCYTSHGRIYVKPYYSTNWLFSMEAVDCSLGNGICNYNYTVSLSVYNHNIYALKDAPGMPNFLNILKSSDYGQTWQNIATVTGSMGGSYYSPFSSTDNFCVFGMATGNNISKYDYQTGILSNDTITYHYDAQCQCYLDMPIFCKIEGSMIYVGTSLGLYKTADFNNWSVVTQYSSQVFLGNNDVPSYNVDGNKLMVITPYGDSVRTSSNGGATFTNYFPPIYTGQNTCIVKGNDLFYVTAKNGNSPNLYGMANVQIYCHHSTDGITWQTDSTTLFDYNGVIMLFMGASRLSSIHVANNKMYFSFGIAGMYEYDYTAHTILPYMQGIKEGKVVHAYLSKNNTALVQNANGFYLKPSNSNQYQFLPNMSKMADTLVRPIITNNQKIFFTSQSFTGSKRFYRSTNNGQTFNQYATGAVATYIHNDSILAFKPNIIQQSFDGGQTFSTLPLGTYYPSAGDEVIASDNNGKTVLMMHNNTLYRTLDFGATWVSMPVADSSGSSNFVRYLIDGTDLFALNSGNQSIYKYNYTTMSYNLLPNNSSGTYLFSNYTSWIANQHLYFLTGQQELGGKMRPMIKRLSPPLYNNLITVGLSNATYSFIPDAYNTGYPTDYIATSESENCFAYQQEMEFLYRFTDNSVFNNAGSNTGRVYVDLNNNSAYDTGEEYTMGAVINSNNGNINVSNSAGFYSHSMVQSIDTLQAIAPPYYNSIPASHYIQVGDTMKDFRFVPSAPANDLSVNLVMSSIFRPGFKNHVYLNYFNIGNTTLSNVNIKYVQPSFIQELSITPAPTTIIGDTLIWNFSSITPFTSGSFDIVDSVPTTSSIGTLIMLMGAISPLANDVTPADNVAHLSTNILGSFDPNDKKVEPSNFTATNLANGDYLNYTIRFQNTGNYYATTVIVGDTIDAMLDINTLQITGTSHNYTLTIKPDRVLEFRFEGINLPDSNLDEAGSHGYIRFKIKPVSTWSVAQSINNTAHIYFDFNAPIVTNTVNSALQIVTSIVNEKVKDAINIFPNPANDVINISFPFTNENLLVTLFTIDGREVSRQIVSGNKATIDASKLGAGVYMLRFKTNEGDKIYKVILE